MRMSRFASSRVAPALPGEWPAWVTGGHRRRQDPLTRLACSVVAEILQQGDPLPDQSAIVVSTSYGSVDSAWRFVSGIAEFGDAGASPTPFTTSVHNSCAGAIGEILGLHGPAVTLSQGCTGGIAALRWATLMLEAERAPAVLLVVGDRHTPWSRDMVRSLSDGHWSIADGVAAALIEPGEGPGRELRLERHAANLVADGGAIMPADDLVLAAAAAGSRRLIAPADLGGWWPCCLLAALPWHYQGAIQLREIEAGVCSEAWLGPLADGQLPPTPVDSGAAPRGA